MTRVGSSGGRLKTPTRPLYAARLPPIQPHPLGADEANGNGEAVQSEPVITTSLSLPKIRPTTARPVGTQLSARTGMSGGASPTGLKPLPAIGEPYRKPTSRSRHVKSSPLRTALKFSVIIMFLSIPVLIFIVMMVLSGGFAPETPDEMPPLPAGMNMPPPTLPANSTTQLTPVISSSLRPATNGSQVT